MFCSLAVGVSQYGVLAGEGKIANRLCAGGTTSGPCKVVGELGGVTIRVTPVVSLERTCHVAMQ